ncbi:MAG: rod shape-determining protein RodA [Chitinophagaceae bacterium]
MSQQQAIISKGINWAVIWIYLVLVAIGFMAIFSVEHKPDENVLQTLAALKSNYAKQLLFIGIGLVTGTFILLTDSKLFTAIANLSYAFGILLMLITLAIHKNINGSYSWIPLGFMNLQPAELCKIFVALALAKYLSRPETDFRKPKSHLIAAIIALSPAILSVAQHEAGLALVYFAFIMVLYREGLPPAYLIIGASLVVLAVTSLIVEGNGLMVALSIIAVLALFFLKRRIRRNKKILLIIAASWLVGVGMQRFAVPYALNNAFECYQSARIMSMVGKEYDCSKNKHTKTDADEKKKPAKKTDDYNVKQSKIAIGSGGLLGKGFLKGTQTQGNFVPEQHTDFIFTAIGESFGFWGSTLLVLIYGLLLFIIVSMAERQRSVFSRVYAYSVASIIFFHVVVNMCMTIGLAPVIGIPLPLISYGGSSLLTFTILLFILVRLDADRQMVLR